MTVFSQSSFNEHEQVVYCNDPITGLKAIIAVHDTTLGPALGGCRFWNYENENEALSDVLRLSRGMTYKAAVAGLNLGGGKAVIIGDPKKLKSEAFFRTFGRFVNSLGGRYITAEDVNINVNDIGHVATETKFCTGLAKAGGSGDPSPITALGVFSGIRAAVKHKLGKDNLSGLKVAVQGAGAVGGFLTGYLREKGAHVYVTDIDEAKVRALVEKHGAEATALEGIHALDVDVYAPCALGGGINSKTIPEIKAPIVAGGANNQLENEDSDGKLVKDAGILYAPDYVINAGGLINVYHEIRGYNAEAARAQSLKIYDTLLEVFEVSDSENVPTQLASNKVAEKRINNVRQMKDLRNSLVNQHWV